MGSNFGKYAIIDPVVFHFEKEPDWWWKINPPTAGDELAMSKFMFVGRAITGPDGVRREYPATVEEVAFREIALTFGGTNIPMDDNKPVEQGGEPFIKVGTSVEDIEYALAKMPTDMIFEIWTAIGNAVPGWGPSKQKKVKEEKRE